MRKIIVLAAVCLCAYAFLALNPGILDQFGSSRLPTSSSEDRIEQAFQNGQSDLQVGGEGTIIAILPDDTKGSRHQRFIIALASGQTLLIAHNIDIAPRIGALSKGDVIEFHGEYEWNAKGGVVHWTHHDPGGRHEDGWIIHRGRKYN